MKDEVLDKEFVSGSVRITRRDLESFPCPFCTDGVTDDQMQLLADVVDSDIEDMWGTGYDISDDRVNETFWAELDNEACRMGIPYYENIPSLDERKKDELRRIVRRWGNGGKLDIRELGVEWLVPVALEDNDVVMRADFLSASDADVCIEWSDGTADSIDRWCDDEEHDGVRTSLAEYIYGRVCDAYAVYSVAIMDYAYPHIDIMKMPKCMYEGIDDIEAWVAENTEYSLGSVYVLGCGGDIEINEKDYNE